MTTGNHWFRVNGPRLLRIWGRERLIFHLCHPVLYARGATINCMPRWMYQARGLASRCHLISPSPLGQIFPTCD